MSKYPSLITNHDLKSHHIEHHAYSTDSEYAYIARNLLKRLTRVNTDKFEPEILRDIAIRLALHGECLRYMLSHGMMCDCRFYCGDTKASCQTLFQPSTAGVHSPTSAMPARTWASSSNGMTSRTKLRRIKLTNGSRTTTSKSVMGKL